MWCISVFGCMSIFIITRDSNFIVASALFAIATQLEWNRKSSVNPKRGAE